MAVRARIRAARTHGLTLIEILVVVGIILIITAMLGAGMRTVTDKARHKAAKALIGRIQTALASYHGEFRDYPPDGYDNEFAPINTPNDVNPNSNWHPSTGIYVGYGNNRRAVKGTAALLYFLCRPVTKVSYMGEANDARNRVLKTVGPFLTIEPSNLTRPETTVGGQVKAFDPNYPWVGGNANAFWGNTGATPPAAGNMIKTEIVDPFGRPLCYDKVKTFINTSDRKYFQAGRFQFFGSMTLSQPHPDAEFLNSMSTSDDEELLNTADWPDYGTTIPATASTTMHADPRFVKGWTGARYNPGTTTTHAPRNVGGYDLWAPGRSWTNARDDITSWD